MKFFKKTFKICTVYLLIAAIFIPMLSGCEGILAQGGVELSALKLKDGVYTVSITNKGGDISASEYSLSCDGEAIEVPDLKAGESVSIALPETASKGASLSLEGENTEAVKLPELISGCFYSKKNGIWGFGNPLDGELYDSLEDMLVFTEDILISEIMPAFGDNKGWIELYNSTGREVDLGAYRLTGDLEDTVRLDGIMLPDSYSVIFFDELDLEIEESLALVNAKRVVSYVRINRATLQVSCGASGLKSCYYPVPTPGGKNCKPITASDLEIKKGRIYINEVMLKNKTGIASLSGKRSAWAELYNPEDEPFSLGGMFLSDDAGDLFKWALPNVSLLGKKHFLVYFAKDAKDARVVALDEISPDADALYLTDIHNRTCQVVPLNNAAEDKSVDSDGKYLDFATPYGDNQTKISRLELIINEVKSVHEAKSGLEDWVEIYNPTDKDVTLDGMYLTDSPEKNEQLALKGTVKAGEYAVFEGLTLAAEGERVYLSDGNCYIDIFDTPKLLPQYSAGRLNGASLTPENKDIEPQNGIYLMSPTKGGKNVSEVLVGYTDAPVFSCDGGYYAEGLELSITAGDGDKIYYTTDGSTPSERSKEYKEPIMMEKTTVIRAIAVRDGYAPSAETVGTFRTGADKHTLPVMCLSMTKSDLDYVCASKDRLDLRERGGYVEYYDVTGAQHVTFPAGFSIGGNGTRKYPQKTFNLHMRGAYGQSEVIYPFFKSNGGIVSYQSLCLRNCGQDGYYTRIRDAFVSMATDGMHMNNAKTYFIIVYLNGKYHGVYEMKENQNEDYFVSHYGCERDSVQLVRNNVKVYNGNGDDRDIKALIKFATETNGNDPEVFARYLEWVDEEAYTDYMIAVGFFVLTDIYNQKSVRSMDGIVKWQPILYDLDSGMPANGKNRKVLRNFFKDGGLFTPSGLKMETVLFNQLYENKQWRFRFAQRYAFLLNTSLSTDNLLSLFEGMVSSLEPEMERHIKRWSTPNSMSKWKSDVEDMRQTITNRRASVLQEIKDVCGLTQQQMKELFPND
ncbi:MAG: CotH kinase family protein [Clostridia bacterium]|nr:CotH kinase family protein [Clostridia bacterium]